MAKSQVGLKSVLILDAILAVLAKEAELGITIVIYSSANWRCR
jgi:hypothetical protein